MKFKIFTLYPQLFENFLSTSLIARAVSQDILNFELINWRNFGSGNYKQIDDKPFGGGSGMVLQVEPMFKALLAHNCLSDFTLQKLQKIKRNVSKKNLDWQNSDSQTLEITKNEKNKNNEIINTILQKNKILENKQNIPNLKFNSSILTNNFGFLQAQILPNNADFYNWQKNENRKDKETTTLSKLGQKENFQTKKLKKAVIMLTPRGFSLNQKICHWLSSFDEITLLCGRFEGFDNRVNSLVDLEISIGDFVTNGGEIPSMCLVEAVGRLVDGFITKATSHEHDSFGVKLNEYNEQKKFVIGKENTQKWQNDWQKLTQIHQKLQK